MLNFSDALLLGGVVAFIFMNLLWLLSLIRKDASIVDIGWGFGYVLIALVLCYNTDEPTAAMRIVQWLVGIWGLRLFFHILARKAGAPEDWRYQQMRERWGRGFWWKSYFQVFILQGVLMMLIALPLFIMASAESATVSPIVYLGMAIWALGFYFESVGDWQLKKFLQNRSQKGGKKSKNSVMQTGLWKYTRHPNYFGEITQWWGIFAIVMTQTNGIFGIISPLLITTLLLKVSGITMLEKRFEDNKEFQKYKKRTSALIPMPPRSHGK